MRKICLPISIFNTEPPTIGTILHPFWEVFHLIPLLNKYPKVCIYICKDICKLFSFFPLYFVSPKLFLLKFISYSHLLSFNILNAYCLLGASENSCFSELTSFDLFSSSTLIIRNFNLQHLS